MRDNREILETLYLDAEELTDELRFSFQHTKAFFTNPNAFDKTNDTGEWVMSCCPNHPESRPSFGIAKDPPYHCNCFYCGHLGTIDELLELVFALEPGDGLKMLLSSYVIEEKRRELDIEGIVASGREPMNIPCLDESVLEGYKQSRKGNEWEYDKRLGYMRLRGFSDKTLGTYEIAIDIPNDCIVFPQRTRKGTLRFVQKRKVGNSYVGAKFINDGSPIKKDIVFGLHFIERLKTTPHRIRRVRMNESPADAMSNYEIGEAAIATNGKLLFKNQIQEMQLAGIEIVDLMFDNDKAGRDGQAQARKKLEKAGFIVNEVIYPTPLFKDSNELLKAGLLHKCKTSYII